MRKVAEFDKYAAELVDALDVVERPVAELCTCIGCPVKVSRLIAHGWQDALWYERRQWRPCDPGCECCQCPNAADGEDALCASCRAAEGISRLVPDLARRLTEFLRAHVPPGELP